MTGHFRERAALILGLIAPTMACGDERSGLGGGADAAQDAGAQPDAGPLVDGGVQDGSDQNTLPTSCTGECRTLSLVVDIDRDQATFGIAYFGLASPETSESGKWEIYVEASFGGDGQCPSEDAPVPDRLFVVSGIPVPESTAPVLETDGASAAFLDFEGSFLPDAPVSRASQVTVTPIAANPCISCSEGDATPDAERFVTLEVQASLAEGTASGRVFATHCDSLDT